MLLMHSMFSALVQRQKEMVKHLYHECMSLEELLEESVNTLGPDARDILAQVRWVWQGCITAPKTAQLA